MTLTDDDIERVIDAWEKLEAGCAGLLASQCKHHAPYMGCPMDCNDVANAIEEEFASARTLLPAALAELKAWRPVIEAAKEWKRTRSTRTGACNANRALWLAIDAALASEPKP